MFNTRNFMKKPQPFVFLNKIFSTYTWIIKRKCWEFSGRSSQDITRRVDVVAIELYHNFIDINNKILCTILYRLQTWRATRKCTSEFYFGIVRAVSHPTNIENYTKYGWLHNSYRKYLVGDIVPDRVLCLPFSFSLLGLNYFNTRFQKSYTITK